MPPIPHSRHPRRTMISATPLDFFTAVNVIIFLMMAFLRYYDRFLEKFGRDRIEEFFIYAVAIFTAVCILWWVFRKVPVSPWTLLLIQAGILLHYAGGFVMVDGERLYLYHLFGLPGEYARFDKLVHFFNAFLAAWLVDGLIRRSIPEARVRVIFVVLATMGLGAGVEIVEYLAVCLVQYTGVGAYDNNMQDLVANFAGALTYAISGALVSRVRGRHFRDPVCMS